MSTAHYKTKKGLEIEVSQNPLSFEEPLKTIFENLDQHKGALFSSGLDYPGKHSRWDIGFINPAIEFISRKKNFYFNALNEQGEAILPILKKELIDHFHVDSIGLANNSLEGKIKSQETFFTEEERSRQPSIFSILRACVELFYSEDPLAAHLGFYGAFGYDLVFQFEQIKLKHNRDQNYSADCHLFLPLEITIVDRKKELASELIYSINTAKGPTKNLKNGGKPFALKPGEKNTAVVSDHQPGEFAKKVEKIIEGCAKGDYFEVVLAQTFQTSFSEKPTALFKRMVEINPSPYMFLINLGEEQLVGASPELFVRVSGNRYETCPIAGTIERGETALEDAARVQELMSSRKDESELTMCTDVDRNDMARVCEPGSVKVIGRRQLEFYSHLIHTVDHLEGYLRKEFDALDAFQTHMWACTVTGAPKPAAIQEIENLENSPRAWYSGAIGMICFNGSLNTGITLRTAHLKDGLARLTAGATLLFDSNPELEELETRTKAAALLKALAGNENLSGKKNQSSPEVKIKLNSRIKILLVDYKDSFVHNLASYLREIGAEVVTLRCGFPEEALFDIKPDLVFLSPGPGTPEEFGVPDFVGTLCKHKFPIFGVCLGHQGIGQHFGGTISKLPTPEHGKVSLIKHHGSTIFAGVPEEFEAGRYHSLYIINETVPPDLEVIAHTVRKDASGKTEIIPMAFLHKTLPIASVQFHPESLMTLKKRAGHLILKNAMNLLTK